MATKEPTIALLKSTKVIKMTEKNEDDAEMATYIIVPSDREEQEKIAEKIFSFFLAKCGYRIIQKDTFDGRPTVKTKNSDGLTVVFCLDLRAKVINMQFEMPLLRWISPNGRQLANTIIDLCWETRRVNILLDREAGAIVLMTAIDIGNLPFEAIADVIETRWQEMEEISKSVAITNFAKVCQDQEEINSSQKI